jgi:RNA polymerase sigma-70 factor, ECF subfamily
MPPIAFKQLPDSPLDTYGLGRSASAVPQYAAQPPASRSVARPWAAPAGTSSTIASRQARATELYREYGALVYRRCARLLKHPEAARDATQEVFAKLVRDLEKLEAREASLRWLYCVATNHCLNHLRDQRRHAEEGLEDALELTAAIGGGSFDRALVLGVLSHFDEATRAVAVAIYVDGMDYDEVAQALGVSKRTVSRKLTKFLATARDLIASDRKAGATAC